MKMLIVSNVITFLLLIWFWIEKKIVENELERYENRLKETEKLQEAHEIAVKRIEDRYRTEITRLQDMLDTEKKRHDAQQSVIATYQNDRRDFELEILRKVSYGKN